jgi:ankyrin repeat protein
MINIFREPAHLWHAGKVSPLVTAVRVGCALTIVLLGSAGVDLRGEGRKKPAFTTDRQRTEPCRKKQAEFLEAVTSGNVEKITKLYRDSCVDAPTGTIALARAVGNGRIDIVRLLLRIGVDPRSEIQVGYSAVPILSVICRDGDVRSVMTLIEAGAQINQEDAGGATPLIWAATGGNAEVVKILLDRGAHVDAKAAWGQTALMMAAARGSIPIVTLLLDAGADIEAETDDGETALSLARKAGNETLVEMLEKARSRKEP